MIKYIILYFILNNILLSFNLDKDIIIKKSYINDKYDIYTKDKYGVKKKTGYIKKNYNNEYIIYQQDKYGTNKKKAKIKVDK